MLWLMCHAVGAEPYPLHEPFARRCLVAAVEEESQKIADDAGSDLLMEPTDEERKALKKRTEQLMLSSLWRAGDSCVTQDGTRWSLVEAETEAGARWSA